MTITTPSTRRLRPRIHKPYDFRSKPNSANMKTCLSKDSFNIKSFNRNLNACATIKNIEENLFNTLLSVINARYLYNEDTPHCDDHMDTAHTYNLRDAMESSGENVVETMLTVKLASNMESSTSMSCFHTTRTVMIQGTPTNVEVFIQDHVVPLFDLVTAFHEVIVTNNIPVTDLIFDERLLCLTCSQCTDLQLPHPCAPPTHSNMQDHTLVTEPATTQLHPETPKTTTPATIHNLSTLSNSFLGRFLADHRSPLDEVSDEESELFPCAQPQRMPLNDITPIPETLTSSHNFTKSPLSKSHKKPRSVCTSTPFGPYTNTRLNALEILCEQLRVNYHSLSNENIALKENVNSLTELNSILRQTVQLHAESIQAHSEKIKFLQNPQESSMQSSTVSTPDDTKKKKNRRRRQKKIVSREQTCPDPSDFPHYTVNSASASMPPLEATRVPPHTPSSQSAVSPNISAICAPRAPSYSQVVSNDDIPPFESWNEQHPCRPQTTMPRTTALSDSTPTNSGQSSQPSIAIHGDSNLFHMRNMLNNALPKAKIFAHSGATFASIEDAVGFSDILVIHAGICDASTCEDPERTRDDISALFNSVVGRAKKVVILPTPPISTCSAKVKQSLAKIEKIMQEEAENTAITVIPVSQTFPTVSSAEGYLFKTDGKHLTQLGAHCVKIVLDFLKDNFPDLEVKHDICVRCHTSGHNGGSCRSRQNQDNRQNLRWKNNHSRNPPRQPHRRIPQLMDQWNHQPQWTSYQPYLPHPSQPSQNWSRQSSWRPQYSRDDLYGGYLSWQ